MADLLITKLPNPTGRTCWANATLQFLLTFVIEQMHLINETPASLFGLWRINLQSLYPLYHDTIANPWPLHGTHYDDIVNCIGSWDKCKNEFYEALPDPLPGPIFKSVMKLTESWKKQDRSTVTNTLVQQQRSHLIEYFTIQTLISFFEFALSQHDQPPTLLYASKIIGLYYLHTDGASVKTRIKNMFNQYQNADVLLVHLSSIVMSSLPGNKVQQKIERICIANCNTEPVTLNLGNNEMDIAMKAGSADNVLDLTLRDAIKGSESSCCNSEYTNVVKWSIPPLPQLLFCSQQIALFVPPTNPEVEGDEGCWIHNGCKLDRFGKATLSRSPKKYIGLQI